MQLKSINGKLPGQAIQSEKNLDFFRKTQIYKSLEKNYMLPFIDQLSLYELEEANAGNRTMPTRNKATYERAVKIIDDIQKNGDVVAKKAKLLSGFTMRQRLCILLLLNGFPPLIFPKYGEELSKKYILYCALILDPGNLTRYREAKMFLPSGDLPSYIINAFVLKTAAHTALVEVGFSGSNLVTNHATEMIRGSIRHVKLIENAQFYGKKENYFKEVDKAYDHLESYAYKIAGEMYAAKPENREAKTLDTFFSEVRSHLKVLFHFDPFTISYTDITFKDVFDIDFDEDYDTFIELRNNLLKEENYSTERSKTAFGISNLNIRC